ncbi:hypothetical protein WJ0W_001859 [Paenibacillus melissococcoides]|uniref:Uncharacterized protein n=1 Tax=Paenibacillus melissococcoides TaxID=2912268 RepID=A0ABM9FZL3_9BACL|nr:MULTISPECIES: hypothetical protein [Paenibacillus]MEB9892359.1 hypothetical protein [Bacillus cereus]CAH8244629.1 hypothetical protein WJ0W_001859 [Paenibacillus melissococcoides]CAH8708541.1 hypothetical protein WDD9_001944 [Paenibacillus melissococcoides]CAH8709257.1 hypothetical protein HTL2_002230 [Paenibacillus melissococcoides]GIO77428.1 hypothetical protein J6TS7_10380 [Paenibacillus dendritiformis]
MSTRTVTWNGLPLHSTEAKARISWIRQEDTAHERLTVREAVRLYMKLYNAFDKSRLQSVLKLTDTVLRWTPAGFKEVILDEDGASQAPEGAAALPQEAEDRSAAEAAPNAVKKQADGSLESEANSSDGRAPSSAASLGQAAPARRLRLKY